MNASTVRTVSLSTAEYARLLYGAVLVVSSPAVFRVTGRGAVASLQGLLTQDIERPGPGTAEYGALLTPKGMIATDCWILRDDTGVTLLIDPAGGDTAREIFRRSLPPRLAKVEDLSGALAACWLYGLAVLPSLVRAGFSVRGPQGGSGTILGHQADGIQVTVAYGASRWPWEAVILVPPADLDRIRQRLFAGGIEQGTLKDADAARVIAGWPSLGAEIGEKTLPQEVRYDEIGAVSYSKGCYVGQETVARVHFRGHPNRMLRALRWTHDPTPPAGPFPPVTQRGKEVGQVTTVLHLPDHSYGLAILRREIEPGAIVLLGAQQAAVIPLPLGPEHL